VADTKLYVEERGAPSGFPLLVFHGGPGLDHTWFGDYLDPLTQGGRYRLVLADERACGRSDRAAPRRTWTLGRMAQDVSDLAASLGVIGGYATLGHSYGAFLVLQHAVDHPGEPRGTIVSAGLAAARWLCEVDRQLAAFEPVELRAAGDVVVGAGKTGPDPGRGERADRGPDAVSLPGAAGRGAAGGPAPGRRACPGRAGCHPPVFFPRLWGDRRRGPAGRGDPPGAGAGRPPRPDVRRRRLGVRGRCPAPSTTWLPPGSGASCANWPPPGWWCWRTRATTAPGTTSAPR